MKNNRHRHHQRPDRMGEHPHIMGNINEVDSFRLKSEHFHGSTGCTVSPAVQSFQFSYPVFKSKQK